MIIDIRERICQERGRDLDLIEVLQPHIGLKRVLSLRRIGIDCLGDLSGTHYTDVQSLYGFGSATLKAIDDVLEKHCLDTLDYGHIDVSSEMYAELRHMMSSEDATNVLERQLKT